MTITPQTKNHDDLGELVSVFKTSVWNYWWAILLSVLILFIALIFWGAANTNKRDPLEAWPLFLILGVLAFLPVLGIILQIKNEARFYENGVEYETRRYVKSTHWAEIRDVWEFGAVVDASGVPLPRQVFYAIRTVDGLNIRFSPRLDDVEKLGEILKTEAVKWGVPIKEGVPPAKHNLMTLLGRKVQ